MMEPVPVPEHLVGGRCRGSLRATGKCQLGFSSHPDSGGRPGRMLGQCNGGPSPATGTRAGRGSPSPGRRGSGGGTGETTGGPGEEGRPAPAAALPGEGQVLLLLQRSSKPLPKWCRRGGAQGQLGQAPRRGQP